MIKRTLLFAALAAGVLFGGMPQVAFADDAEASATKSVKKSKKGKKSKKKSKKSDGEHLSPELKAALESRDYYNGKTPDLSAEYFMILSSASWCGPCKALMPQLVAAYPTMKKMGVEVILSCNDRTLDAAKAYADHYNLEFPAMMVTGVNAIPGYVSSRGIPNTCIIDAQGKTVKTAVGGAAVLQWKKDIEAYEAKNEAAGDDAAADAADEEPEDDDAAEEKEKKDDGPGAVVEAMKGVKFINAKPSKKADYYIYLHSASWCGPCKAIMPQIAKEYKKMKRAGVEVILMGHDKDEKGVKDYIKHYKVKMPALVSNAPEALAMPGNPAQVAGIPHAVVVDKDGNVIRAGHGSLVLEWKEICK